MGVGYTCGKMPRGDAMPQPPRDLGRDTLDYYFQRAWDHAKS
jgi:hypothetical protein